MTSIRCKIFVSMLAVLAALFFLVPYARAKATPFKVKGGGTAPEGLSVVGGVSPYTASGTATHLGKYTGFGVAQVTGIDATPTDPNALFTGTFTGGFVFVAANGDKLVCKHPGTFAVYFDGIAGLYAIFDAEFTPATLTIDGVDYKSTGRFADAEGGFRMIATTESFLIDPDTGSTTPFDFSWQGTSRWSR